MEFVNEKKKKGTFEHEFMTAFYESWYETLSPHLMKNTIRTLKAGRINTM